MDQKSRNPELLSKALSLSQAGNLNEADALCREILSSEPGHSGAMTLLGNIHLQRGDWQEGIRLIGLSLENNPRQSGAINNLGISLYHLERYEEALASFDRLVALDPGNAQAYNNRGNVLNSLNRHEEALASYDRAIALNPRYAEAHTNRANALSDLNRHDEALASCDRAIALNPGQVQAYNNRGNSLNSMKRYEEALASCDRAIALNPRYAEAYSNRGNTLGKLNRYEEALASYDRAIALNPRYAEAYSNRGNTLCKLNRYEEALASCDLSIALNPTQAEAHNNRANALSSLQRYIEALASYDRAIALNPEHAYAKLNKGFVKILLGEYEEGWKLHESRWKPDEIRNWPPRPLWLGQEKLTGMTILLHAEQGFGDTIQFCRYAPMAEALGAKVLLQVPPVLVPLISTLKDSIRVIAAGNPLPGFDYHCPLMSLPLAFGTTVSTIPAKIPYLGTDPVKQGLWQSRTGKKTGKRVGLAWSGRKEHQNDHNRSIPLSMLAPLLDLDLEFHCLQKEIRPADREFLKKCQRIRLYENDLDDFSDTAALVSEMDLVVSVDTSVVHLAGAVGKPVWILLPFSPDYRWMTEREDSPWYPTARLFRQPQIGDWTGVIMKITAELNVF